MNQIPPHKGGPNPKLVEDGLVGPKTIGAIRTFQQSDIALAKDGRVDPNGPTLARINAQLGYGTSTKPKFHGDNLYGPNGPSQNDIKQDAFGDCYFVATLGAVAMQNPKGIKDAIYYDESTQQFRVRLYKTNGQVKYIWVTQAELEDNVNRQGGSYIDNTGLYERVWPAVIETAYAKMFDSNPNDGLGEGYQKIINGGWPSDAMMAITGNAGSQVSYTYYLKLGVDGSVAVLGGKVATALQQHKSVTLWSVPENGATQDGLVDDHVYTVISMLQQGTDWRVTVRNPWGTNMGVGEGKDQTSPIMTLSLRTLVTTGGLQSFRVSN
ncbi:hypothetical protein F183_A01260 [Bryobacterales bacterium F-183]|nr:hypothetical protein F183_A01260 [Bryobacterales bacterium F-183]